MVHAVVVAYPRFSPAVVETTASAPPKILDTHRHIQVWSVILVNGDMALCLCILCIYFGAND